VQRNFGLRPDLVTLPLPAARGSAAVPSVADVYIKYVKTSSQDVGAGPYLLSNMPADHRKRNRARDLARRLGP